MGYYSIPMFLGEISMFHQELSTTAPGPPAPQPPAAPRRTSQPGLWWFYRDRPAPRPGSPEIFGPKPRVLGMGYQKSGKGWVFSGWFEKKLRCLFLHPWCHQHFKQSMWIVNMWISLNWSLDQQQDCGFDEHTKGGSQKRSENHRKDWSFHRQVHISMYVYIYICILYI